MSSVNSRRNRFIPRLEALEDRNCPSPVLTIHGHTLTVFDDNSSHTITITDDGNGGVSASIGGDSAGGTDINHIVVHTRGGDDIINYTLTNPLTRGTALNPDHLQFILGSGSDQLNLDFSQGVTGANLRIGVNSHGSAQVTSTFGTITDSSLGLRANLGRHDDSLTLNFNGDIAGDSDVRLAVHGGSGVDSITANFNANVQGQSQVRFDVHGGAGADSINVNANATNIDADAALFLRLLGDSGNDTINVAHQGQLNGTLSLLASGGPGKDTVVANITADAGSTGTIKARVFGGPSSDDLTLNVNDNSGSGTPTGDSTLADLDAVVDGGPSHDTIAHTPNVTVRHG